MAGLVPYDAENITANWSSSAKQFSVTATALLPVPFTFAEFKRVDNVNNLGGRKFRLEGARGGGAGVPKQTMMQKPYIENDFTAPPRFPAISVTLIDPVKKIEATVSINVTVDAPGPQPVPLQPQPMPTLPVKGDPSTLKTIEITLPPQHFVRITAPISDNTSPRPAVEGRTDGNFTFIWRAGELPGFVYWDVAWAGNGAGVGKADIFRVTTTVAKGTQSGNALGQVGGTGALVVVQPYAINLPETRRDLVDLFDPDA
jgi:hypothetical protein